MAIINNNVQNVKFLRNQTPFGSRDLARQALENNKAQAADGTALLARYTADNDVKTLVGFVAEVNSTKYVTIIDVEGGSADVEKLREEINAKLGTTFISSGNTVEANLTALSGTSSDASGVTSVWGAKAYADDLISTLDYTDAAVAGQYVSQVTQSDGKIAVVRVELPSSADTAVAKKFVTAVAEDKGQIVVSRGEISSSAETMVLTDNADGGVNFEVNIDGVSIVQDPTSKKLKVADTALTQYYGDEKTVHAEVDSTNNTKTFSTLLKIVKNANPSETEVKEEYFLANADGTAITGADTIKIYKDSHIVSITYITDSGDTHYQNLEYKYIDASGATKTEYVDISSLVLEAEFASGVTITNHVAHGVVDPQSEKDSQSTPVDFLTVGADGFKVSGIKDEIDRKINALDATVTDATSGNHVTITIEEVDGKLVQSGLTIEENDIASASDLTELSGKTITAITSANGSITAQVNDAVGNKTANIQTDADKIQMSGFTPVSTASSLSNIVESDSIATAFEKVDAVITENERVTAEALTDLDGRLDKVEDEYISGITVNGSGVTVSDNVAALTLASAPSTGATATPIIVETSNNGGITLKFDGLDCGFYA